MTAREWLHTLYVPVLVGDSRAVRQTARCLFWCYGLVSHVFSQHHPVLLRLLPFTVCHHVPRSSANDISVIALSDFAGDVLEADRQPLLILCDDTHDCSEFCTLESQYLICRKEQLPKLFAGLIQSTQGEQSL